MISLIFAGGALAQEVPDFDESVIDSATLSTLSSDGQQQYLEGTRDILAQIESLQATVADHTVNTEACRDAARWVQSHAGVSYDVATQAAARFGVTRIELIRDSLRRTTDLVRNRLRLELDKDGKVIRGRCG